MEGFIMTGSSTSFHATDNRRATSDVALALLLQPALRLDPRGTAGTPRHAEAMRAHANQPARAIAEKSARLACFDESCFRSQHSDDNRVHFQDFAFILQLCRWHDGLITATLNS
jgi:hypothetical protein